MPGTSDAKTRFALMAGHRKQDANVRIGLLGRLIALFDLFERGTQLRDNLIVIFV